MKIIINSVDWVTEPHSILARVKEEIDRNLNGHTTGTFVLTMDGPTTGENAMLVALGGSYSNSGPETTARYKLVKGGNWETKGTLKTVFTTTGPREYIQNTGRIAGISDRVDLGDYCPHQGKDATRRA